LKTTPASTSSTPTIPSPILPPATKLRKPKTFDPFQPPSNTKSETQVYVRRYPSESHSTKPISHGHPPLDEFMSIENLKTYGMSPSSLVPVLVPSIATSGVGSTSRLPAAVLRLP